MGKGLILMLQPGIFWRISLVLLGFLVASLTFRSPVRGQDANSTPRNEPRGTRAERPKCPKDAIAEKPLPADIAALTRLSCVLGRPTERSVTVSVLSAEGLEGYCEYGIASGNYARRTDLRRFPARQPVELVLESLPPNQLCRYRFCYRRPGAGVFTENAELTFHTQRAPGSTFTFEIQGDSHPERPQMFNPELYAQTLRAAAADHPDFYLTSGDDFSVDTLRTIDAEAVRQVYLRQRPFLGLVAQTAPLFLVNGNHEQAARCNLDGTANNVAVWAQQTRNTVFPQPAPDHFYTGDTKPVEPVGLLRDYYAWTWGDALFVVIDPYWHSPQPVDNVLGGRKKNRDLWNVTLGDEQYQWLRKTLESSKAAYKFVFAHHVHGTGRGGIEQAGLFEWGGKNKNGVDEFARQRPGWDCPIHQLMARHGVTIFFQGHDHIFVHQQLDNVVYQTLPLPADPNYASYNKEAYHTGEAFPGSGRVRVTVSPAKVRVEYVRSYLPQDATAQHPDGEVAFAYELTATVKAKE